MNTFMYPHIAINVNNIEESKKFYTAIGFKVIFEDISREKQRHVLLLEGYNFQVEVFYFDDQMKNQHVHEEYKKVGILHFAIPVKDLSEVKNAFLKNKIEIYEDIRRTSLGVLNFTLLDPSGITVEFFQGKKNRIPIYWNVFA